jgi:hypothetical protein
MTRCPTSACSRRANSGTRLMLVRSAHTRKSGYTAYKLAGYAREGGMSDDKVSDAGWRSRPWYDIHAA